MCDCVHQTLANRLIASKWAVADNEKRVICVAHERRHLSESATAQVCPTKEATNLDCVTKLTQYERRMNFKHLCWLYYTCHRFAYFGLLLYYYYYNIVMGGLVLCEDLVVVVAFRSDSHRIDDAQYWLSATAVDYQWIELGEESMNSVEKNRIVSRSLFVYVVNWICLKKQHMAIENLNLLLL